jgi:hypothetical protein
LKLTLEVYNSEWFDDGADYAVVELSDEFLSHVERISKFLSDNDLNTATEYANIELMIEDQDAEELKLIEYQGRSESEEVILGRDGFCWRGTYKHSDYGWETEFLTIEALKEMLAVEAAELEELPPMMATLKTEAAQKKLKARLEGKDAQ